MTKTDVNKLKLFPASAVISDETSAVCQMGSQHPQRSAIISTNAIMDNATVDHPPP